MLQKSWPFIKIIRKAIIKQNKPAIATVVNFGAFLHLKVTENTENPIDDVIPKTNPMSEFFHHFRKPLL